MDDTVQPQSNESSPSPNQTITARLHLAGLGAAGVWLLLLISISVFLAIIIFSASQFQSRIASLTLNGSPLTIWKAEPVREQWLNAREVSKVAARNLAESEATTAKFAEENNSAATEANKAELYARQTHLQLINIVAVKDPNLANMIRQAATDLQIDVVNKLRAGQLKQLAEEDSQVAGALDDFVRHFEHWKFHEGALLGYQEQLDRARQTTQSHQVAFTVALKNAELGTLIGKQAADQAQRAQIENAIFEFEAVHSLLWGVVYKFSLLPSDFLVLILVIVMGILGSSLQLSYIYVNEFANRNISFYILRPFLGVLTALVVFIVTKAGVPLLTDTSKLGGNAPINPYFISFIAIISGLLSERALETLRRIGSDYFSGNDPEEPERWALGGLRGHFETIKRDPHQLKDAVGVDERQIDDWIDGKSPIPLQVQRLIAAVVDKPRREIFSDLAPS